jgi:hypothetical protein
VANEALQSKLMSQSLAIPFLFIKRALNGVKLADEMMEDFLDDIDLFTAEEALGCLMQRGWTTGRTKTANWFNKVAGYGAF